MEEREGFVINVAELMSKKSRRNSIRSSSLQTHTKSYSEESLRKFYSDGWDLQEHLQRRAQRAIISAEKISCWMSSTWRSRIWSEENSEYSLFESQRKLESQRLQFLEDIHWTDQVKCVLSRWSWNCEYTVANWRWRAVFIKEATQEVAKNLKNWKEAAIKRKILKKQQRLDELSYAAWSGITNSESILLRSWLTEQLWHTFLIKLLVPRVQESRAAKLECREIHERIWVFLETFWSSTCSTRSWWIFQFIQEFGQHHWGSLPM